MLEQGVARSQAHVDDVDSGSPPASFRRMRSSSAEAQESRARMLAIEARNQRDVASAELARLSASRPISRSSRRRARATRRPRSRSAVDPLVESARANPRRSGARSNGESSGSRCATRRGRRGPSADDSVPRRRGLRAAEPDASSRAPIAGQDSWDAGVSATWSLWDGGRTDAEVAQAGRCLEARERAARRVRFSCSRVEVRQRALDLESGRGGDRGRDERCAAAADARRVVDERYQAGVIAQIEVLDAEYALLQAQLDRTRAQASVRLAEARLTRAIGR